LSRKIDSLLAEEVLEGKNVVVQARRVTHANTPLSFGKTEVQNASSPVKIGRPFVVTFVDALQSPAALRIAF